MTLQDPNTQPACAPHAGSDARQACSLLCSSRGLLFTRAHEDIHVGLDACMSSITVQPTHSDPYQLPLLGSSQLQTIPWPARTCALLTITLCPIKPTRGGLLAHMLRLAEPFNKTNRLLACHTNMPSGSSTTKAPRGSSRAWQESPPWGRRTR